jgi:hypothetical protein
MESFESRLYVHRPEVKSPEICSSFRDRRHSTILDHTSFTALRNRAFYAVGTKVRLVRNQMRGGVYA